MKSLNVFNMVMATAFAVVFVLFGSVSFAGGYVNPITSAPPMARPATTTADSFSWTGPYAGLSYGSQKTKSTRMNQEERDITETRYETRPANKADIWNQTQQAGGCSEPRELFWFTHESADPYVITCDVLMSMSPDDSWNAWSAPWADPVIESQWEEVIGSEMVSTGPVSHHTTDSTLGAFIGYRYQFQNRLVLGSEATYTRVSNHDEDLRLLVQTGYAMGNFLPYVTAGYSFDASSVVFGLGMDVALTNRLIGGLVYTQEKDSKSERIEARIGFKF